MQVELKEKINFLIETSKIGVSKDFTAEEKQLVFAQFEPFGLTAPTCRNRFFRDGWRRWEIDGILDSIITYAETHPEVQGLAEEARKFTFDSPVSDIQTLILDFYEALETKRTFVDYMETLGFSHSSSTSHFRNPATFIPWELFGIRRIWQSV